MLRGEGEIMRVFIEGCGVLALLIGIGALEGTLVVFAGHNLTRALWSLGATEAPAAWVAYAIALGVVVWGQITVWQRIEHGTWK